MKKIRILSLMALAVVAVALLTCCGTDFENGKDDLASLELSSVSSSDMPAKAVIDGTAFPTAMGDIGLFLYADEAASKPYGDGCANVQYSYNSSKEKWTANPSIEVGSTPGYLYGYYPYDSESTNIRAIPISSSVNGDDVMYATKQTVTAATAPQTSITMNHALARVSMTVKNNGYTGDAKLTNIKFAGAKTAETGTLNATDGSITATQSDVTLAVPSDSQIITSGGTVYECLLVPSGVEPGKQSVDLTLTIDGEDKTVTLSGDNGVIIAQGTKSNITIDLSSGGISVQTVSVEDWNVVEVGGHKVMISVADGVTPHDLLVEAYADGNVVKILVFSQSKSPLGCALSVGADLSKEQKTDGVTVFTISNIGSDVTATIHYVFTVSVSPNIIKLGTVSGGGSYLNGTTTTLTATANTGYIFVGWRDANWNILDWTNPQEITVISDMKVIAVFGYPASEGNVLNGEFTVNNSGKVVRFSKGNLYCSGVEFNTDGTVKSMDNAYWGFEGSQFGHTPGENKVSRVNNHISHFMWCKDYQNSLASKYDSGWNNQTVFFANNIPLFNEDNFWSVLSKDEWVYLLNTEGTTDGSARNQTNRFAKAKVHGVNGVLLFPDGCVLPPGYNSDGGSGMSKINDIRATYPEGGMPNEVWDDIEAVGVVFLPAAGERFGNPGNDFRNLVLDVGSNVYLWSSSPCTTDGGKAYCIFFGTTFANPSMDIAREYALSVRLVTIVKE